MTRNEFMIDLGMLLRPRAPHAAAKQLEAMLPYLTEIPDEAFDPALLPAITKRLKRNPMLGDVYTALEASLEASRAPFEEAGSRRREVPLWLAGIMGDTVQQRLEDDERHRQLSDEWGITSAVRHAVEISDGNPRLLGVLRGLVQRWAPQNADLIPPPAGAA
jgi:hypothetical protein